jgi:pilus assembly protein CpaB
MIKERNVTFFILALLFVTCASVFVFFYIKNYEHRILVESKMIVPILGASSDIAAGSQIDESMITTLEWPKKTVPQNTFTNKENLVGRVVKTAVTKSMPFVEEMLFQKGEGLSYFIPQNMRAMDITLDENSDSSFIVPGSCVDILATFKTADSSPRTKTIVQNVKVLAVNGKKQNSVGPNNTERVQSVTVLISPDDAEVLTLAKSRATIQFVLRNPGDTLKVKQSGIDEESILYDIKKDVSKTESTAVTTPTIINTIPGMAAKKTVTVIKGTESQEVSF